MNKLSPPKNVYSYGLPYANTATPVVESDQSFPVFKFHHLAAWSGLSGIAWLVVINSGTMGEWIGVAGIGFLVLTCLVLLSKRRITESLSIVMYLAMVQPALRGYVTILPYYGLDYFFLFWFALAINKFKLDWLLPAKFYLAYILIELAGTVTALNFEYSRAIFISSLVVGSVLVLASGYSITKENLRQLLFACTVGVFSLIVLILHGYISNNSIQWSTSSNFSSSGDMGPVQISMLLAVGVVIFLVLADRVRTAYRLIYLVIATVLSVLMILTFSRSGLYLAGIALITYYLLFSKFSWRSFVIIITVAILGIYAFDIVTQIAGQAAIERFSDINSTNRDVLARYGWQIFLDNPIFGVGTGNYYTVVSQAEYLGSVSGAHNEFIRAAAEHGILGFITWVGFALSAVWVAFRQSSGKVRSLRMTLVLFFFAYLFVNGLKLLIQPLLLFMALSIDEF